MTKLRITETGAGWEAGTACYLTAAEALRAVQADSRERARAKGADVVVIEWEPVTRIGRMVVMALQEPARNY